MSNPTSPANADHTATLLDEVRDMITRYVALPTAEDADILALYVVHTHAFQASKVTPYIYINSAERGSGKTLVLEILEALTRNSMMESNLSAASLFRVIEARRPTMLVDEVDAIFSGAKNEDLRGVLNSGYKHNGSVLRADPKADEEDGGVKSFSTFCPKVLAGIDNGMIPDTIADRSIFITLRRANAEQIATLEDYYFEDVEDEMEALTVALTNWATDNMTRLTDRDERPARLDALGPRQNEIARPLLTIGKVMGHGWAERAERAIIARLAKEDQKLSAQAAALNHVREWFAANPTQTKIASATVATITGQNGKQIGVWFGAYGIKPGTYNIAGKNAKGYRHSDFTDAFERYLPAQEVK